MYLTGKGFRVATMLLTCLSACGNVTPEAVELDHVNSVQQSIIRLDLNGLRLKHPVSGEVFLIHEGTRRLIPNPTTYNSLFRDWNGIITDINVDTIDRGPDLSPDAILLDCIGGKWMLTNGKKFGCGSGAAFDRYWFGGIQTKLAPIVCNSIPSGSVL